MVNEPNKKSPAKENKPVVKDEKQELSESAQARQDARLHAVGDASDPENVTKGHNKAEKGEHPVTNDMFPAEEDSAVVAARKKRLAKTVGDASDETDGKVYGRSSNPDDIEKYKG